jgi:hypothetical protein
MGFIANRVVTAQDHSINATHTIIYFSPMTQQLLVGQVHLTIEASRSHSDTPHSVDLLWMGTNHNYRILYVNTQSQETGVLTNGDIRTRNSSKGVVEDIRLLPTIKRLALYSIVK